MEVATLFTSSEKVVALFNEFINSYKALTQYDKDDDTIFFNGKDGKLWYHFVLIDSDVEFGYNYSVGDVNTIERFYKDKKILMFDMSYATEAVLIAMLKAFKNFLATKSYRLIADILISHPFEGLVKLGDV